MAICAIQPAWRDASLPVTQIIVSRDFQPRADLIDHPTVDRYASAMRRGDTFDPIKVAKVSGRLYVIDGYHRLEAAKRIRRETIDCLLAPMTKATAKALAIDANVKHGLPLKGKDRRRCFEMYHQAGLHLNPNGTMKSLRTIKRELGDIAWPNTIRAWLAKANIQPPEDDEFPSRRWEPEEPEDTFAEEEMNTLTTIKDQLDQLVASYHSLETPEAREKVKADLRAALEAVQEKQEELTGPWLLDI